jgi:hypothetical protein
LPDENFCGGHELSVGSNNKAAVLLRFDLTELPETAYGLNSEAIVQQATLSLYGVQGTRDTAISTYVARREWEACAITWNQPWQEPGADGELDRDAESWQEVVSPRMPGWLEFDVTELVQSWLREPASNLGLMIKSFDARWPSHHIFFASDHPATTSRPKLTIEYQPVRATRTPVSPTVTPTAEQIPEPSAVVTPEQPLGPRVIEVRWSEQMAVGDPHEVTVTFRPATTSESATGSSPSHVLSVAAHLTAPSFDMVSDSPTSQAMEDAAGSLSWSWSVTPRMAGSQLLSLDLLFTWQPMVGASTEVRAEPGMWYLTRTIEVGTPPADSTLETVRNVLAAVGLVCMIGFYVLRWRDLGA